MSLNQILHDEQIAMMRHASATSLSELAAHRGEIDRISKMLSRFTYPHRPYLATVRRPTLRLRTESAGS